MPMVKTGAEGAPGEAGATNGPEDGPVEVKAGEAGGSAPGRKERSGEERHIPLLFIR